MLENKGALVSNRRYAFSVSELPAQTFEVVNFDGEEALSTLYRFDLLLASTDSDIAVRALIGQAAQFSLNDGVEGGRPTVYRGLVQSFAYQYQISGWTFYRVTLVPKMWLLDTFNLSEIYLDKTRPEIFTTIMNNAGFTSNDFSVRFQDENAAYPKRDYICQYRESYLTFISRWAERLGIYWWHEEAEGKEKIVFTDTRMTHKDEALLLHYQAAGELDAVVGQKRRLQNLELEARNLPKQIVIRDYSAQRASMEIMGTATVDPLGNGEEHFFGEHLRNNEEAAHIAQLRAEGMIARGDIYHGGSTATGLRCGEFMQVKDHPRKHFNQRYLITGVRHKGSQAGLLLEGLRVPVGVEAGRSADFYLAGITAIPSDVQFRPETKHPWPRIIGTLNAFVDAEGSGKYAELNEKGEYKIQVPFDITNKNAQRGSAWIRMATPYAGSDHGMHFPLHKGTEVVLSFINGDPDQPIILGAIPNSLNHSVVENANQMQSRIRTAGGNEITLHDEEGKQHMLFKTPNGNTWFRMGASGFDPAAASYSYSSKARPGMQQQWQAPPKKLSWQGSPQMWQGGELQMNASRQQQQQITPTPNPLTDGTYDTTGGAGFELNTDESFGLGAGGAVQITADVPPNTTVSPPSATATGITLTANSGDISLNATSRTANSGDISLNATNGDVNVNASNGTFTLTSSEKSWWTWGNDNVGVGGDANKIVFGTSDNLYAGSSISAYLWSLNFYALYTNMYLCRYDYQVRRYEYVGFKQEMAGFITKKVALALNTNAVTLDTVDTHIDNKLTSITERLSKLESNGSVVRNQAVAVNSTGVQTGSNGVSSEENAVEKKTNGATFNDGGVSVNMQTNIFAKGS
jgi:type VI secretion system VgrG family protein